MGHELGSKNPNWKYPSARWVREAERKVELDRKLSAILGGREKKPSEANESLTLAQMCYDKKLHAASARFWAEAFEARMNLADDMNVQNRYNAACAAALAGSGEGKDEPPLDDAKKAHWRKQSVEWLNADLAAWSKILASGPPQAKPFIVKTLQHWKADTDLAGVRDAAALAKLSGDEQKACRCSGPRLMHCWRRHRAPVPGESTDALARPGIQKMKLSLKLECLGRDYGSRQQLISGRHRVKVPISRASRLYPYGSAHAPFGHLAWLAGPPHWE